MKSIKTLIVAGCVAISLAALQAKAQFIQLPFPVAHQFEPLNFNLVVSQQALVNSNPSANVTVSTTKNEKLTTQSILSLLAQAYGTNWPSGAKLAIDFANDWDIFVVDKTGTVPIFDVSQGVYDTNANNYVYLYLQTDGSSVVSSKAQTNSKGRTTYHATTTFDITFTLEVEVNGNEETRLEFSGLDTDVFQLSVANVASQTDHMPVAGDGMINGSTAEVSGGVSGSGTWKGPAQ